MSVFLCFSLSFVLVVLFIVIMNFFSTTFRHFSPSCSIFIWCLAVQTFSPPGFNEEAISLYLHRPRQCHPPLLLSLRRAWFPAISTVSSHLESLVSSETASRRLGPVGVLAGWPKGLRLLCLVLEFLAWRRELLRSVYFFFRAVQMRIERGYLQKCTICSFCNGSYT